VFPNPITTGTVRVLPQAYTGLQTVTVQIYTASFKLVTTKIFTNRLAGQTVDVALVDNWGQPLASGLFYICVSVDRSRKTTSLVIAP